jgi:hypothetical protein
MTPNTTTTKQQLVAWEIMDKEGDGCGEDCLGGSGRDEDEVGSSAPVVAWSRCGVSDDGTIHVGR